MTYVAYFLYEINCRIKMGNATQFWNACMFFLGDTFKTNYLNSINCCS